jgi:16S rRNA processing protein RimM
VTNEFVTVGRIVRPQGNRGEVVIAPETDFGAMRFQVGAEVLVQRDGVVEALKIRESREYQGRWIVGFAGVSSIDAAEGYRGVEVVVPGDRLEKLGPGQYYLHDLVGCRVETIRGFMIGEVVRVDREIGTPVLVVAAAGGEVMVPFAEAICRQVDVEGKRIVIDPPEGLLDL